MTSMTSSFRKASSQVNSFLSRKMKEGRERAIARGQDTKELADCVLDLICSRETGADKLTDRALRDELFTFLLGGEETG
jgi:cytochrome P450